MFESYIHSHIHFVTHTKKHIRILTAPFGFLFFFSIRLTKQTITPYIQESKEHIHGEKGWGGSKKYVLEVM